MPDPQAHGRAVYDHADEDSRAPRRRRQVADWGVGEELFDHMPSRRFARRGADHRVPRGGADDGRRTSVIERAETEPPAAAPAPADDDAFASREQALRARAARDALWGGDEPFADASAPAVEAPATGDEAAADDQPGRTDEPAAVAASLVAPARPGGGVDGRRTVKIGGRPGEFFPPSERRRPARPVHE